MLKSVANNWSQNSFGRSTWGVNFYTINSSIYKCIQAKELIFYIDDRNGMCMKKDNPLMQVKEILFVLNASELEKFKLSFQLIP